jgi:hypothetical protein
MSDPWFQPHGFLKYRPLNWKGRTVLAATWVVVAAFGLGGFFLTEAESPAWWITGVIAFSAFLVGHAVVLWKMDGGFGRN